MRSIHRLFYFVFILSAVFAQSNQAKPTAAVLDFEGSGITNQEAQVLTERLGSELVQTDVMIMVERNQMSEIMDEQGLQQSGCTTAECAAEIGALLGVQKMITGSFGKIGNTYTIEARMFSVETGTTEKSVSKTYKGEVDGLLPQIQIVAWELVGLQPPADLLARVGGDAVVAAPGAPKKPMSKGSKRLMWTVLILGGGLGGAYAAGLFDTPPVPLPEPPVLPGG